MFEKQNPGAGVPVLDGQREQEEGGEEAVS